MSHACVCRTLIVRHLTQCVHALLAVAGDWVGFLCKRKQNVPSAPLGASETRRTSRPDTSSVGFHVWHNAKFMHVTRTGGKCPNCGNPASRGFHVPRCGGLVWCELCCIECRLQEGYRGVATALGIVPYLGECGVTREDRPLFPMPAAPSIADEVASCEDENPMPASGLRHVHCQEQDVTTGGVS